MRPLVHRAIELRHLTSALYHVILQAPMSEAVRQFLITSLQNGFFGNPSTPNAVGQVACTCVALAVPDN
jgi:hypothetical protein